MITNGEDFSKNDNKMSQRKTDGIDLDALVQQR